ncbi:MAG: membrane protein insertion efficiency factor YidD [Armatimonadetes bacterium]|nr:membrane protein insertion efficiency factor YidD [Armatimonadota bacterium]
MANLRSAPPVEVTEPALLRGDGRAAPLPEKEWSVLVALDGRNRLASSTLRALNKMEQVGSSSGMHVVAQATVEPTWRERHKPHMRAVPTRRYYIRQDQDPGEVTSPVVGELDGLVPLSQKSLTDFLIWGMRNFPSRKTMLIVKKHGAGFARVGDMVPLSARELEGALEAAFKATGKRVDVVSFDACCAQQMEVAYQLRDQAAVMTGSPENVLADAYPYGTFLEKLRQHPESDPQETGKLVVESYRQVVPRGIQSAADLKAVAALNEPLKRFTASVVEHQVAPNLIYTAMLNASSMEAGESSSLLFDFRDLGGFLSNLAGDERVPQAVREAAAGAREAVGKTVLDHYTSPGRERLKKPTGYSAVLPWKAMEPEVRAAYGQLAFARDTGWMDLLDYVFADRPARAQSEPPAAQPPQASWLSRVAKIPLKHYKHYVSAYLPTRCQYTPTCSQYTRQAIEEYGLFKGAWKGALRVLSCNGYEGSGEPIPDPCGHHHAHDLPAGVASHDFLADPPVTRSKSKLRKDAENLAVSCAGVAAGIAGALVSGTLALPLGAVAGACFGYLAGTAGMDGFTAGMLESHRPATVHGMLLVARPVGKTADRFNQWVAHTSGSQGLANALGAVVGPVTGAVRGALGSVALLGHEGYRYGRLWGRNIVKDHVGELPVCPENEAIVRRDYR